LTRQMIKKIVTGLLLFGYIIIASVDALLHGKTTYSSIMAMDINRVYFYTFFLLIMGCWLLYNKWFVGIGFLALAAFSSYFVQFTLLHNYFASVIIYIGIIVDVIIRRRWKWLVPLISFGVIQGIAFETAWFGIYMVGAMEFFALCVGSIFVVKTIQ